MEDRVEPSREEQALELLVFLLLFLPSIVLSFFFTTGMASPSFVLVAVSTIFRDLALMALILFFLWRNGETEAKIGWTAQSLGRNVLLGLALFPFVLVGAAALSVLLQRLGLSGPEPSAQVLLIPSGLVELALAALLVVVVAVAEETIFRGYLIARLEGISGSTALAVVLSSVIFAIGHGYEGTAGIVAVGFMGLVFALLFVWTRSLVAPIIIHFLNNFVAIVLLPLLV